VSRSRADSVEVRSEHRPSGRLIEPTLGAVDALAVDSIVVGLCRDVRPLAGALGMIDWRLCGRLSRLLESGTITGDLDEKILFPTSGRLSAPRLFIYGWGPVAEAKGNSAGRLSGMVQMLDQVKAERVAFAFPEPARHFIHLAGEVEACLGARLVAMFGADPLPPL
jgi:hypothetical protein